jgi:hypothetical protein
MNMQALGLAFESLQQLRQLKLSFDGCLADAGVGLALRHITP